MKITSENNKSLFNRLMGFMHKTLIILITVFTILSFLEVTSAGVNVSPAELSITMNDGFIQGNTSKKITIYINENDPYNVSWYLEHPNPIDWIRPNKTTIPNLSWIDVEPKWQIIQAYSYANFYIHLSIPEQEDLLGQHWETWVTFKFDNLNSGSIIGQEYAVRTYIDTPAGTPTDNTSNQGSNENKETENSQPLLIVVAIAVAALLFIIILIVIKKSKKV